MLAEFVTDPKHKQAAEFISAEADFGRAFFLPPGVPAERVALLRKAFEAAMKDPALLAEAKKKKPADRADRRGDTDQGHREGHRHAERGRRVGEVESLSHDPYRVVGRGSAE